MRCPKCRVGLQQTKTPAGMIFHCPQCDGQAVSLAVLRRFGSREAVEQLWKLAKEAHSSGGKCPACDSRMAETVLPVGAAVTLRLEVCTACQFAWLDAGERDKFPAPEPAQPEKTLSPQAQEAIAMRHVQMVADQAEREEQAEKAARPHTWHALAHLLQIPFK